MAKSRYLEKARRKADKLGLNGPVRTLVVCMDRKSAKCCDRDRMIECWQHIKRRAKEWHRDGGAPVLRLKSACIGICSGGPLIGVLPDGVWYGGCDETVIDRIFAEHLMAGTIVESNVVARRTEPGS